MLPTRLAFGADGLVGCQILAATIATSAHMACAVSRVPPKNKISNALQYLLSDCTVHALSSDRIFN
jgi:hypothetical protein